MANKKTEKNDLVENEELTDNDLENVAGGAMSTQHPARLEYHKDKDGGYRPPAGSGGSTTPGGGSGDPTGGASAEYGDVLE